MTGVAWQEEFYPSASILHLFSITDPPFASQHSDDLRLSEEVDLEVYFNDLNIDDSDNREEAQKYVSPFSNDEYYLEEPTGLRSNVAST